MKFKKGDIVVVKTFSDFKKEKDVFVVTYPYNSSCFTASKKNEQYHFSNKMSEWSGKKITINYSHFSDSYLVKENNFIWQDWMFMRLDQAKIKRILESNSK